MWKNIQLEVQENHLSPYRRRNEQMPSVQQVLLLLTLTSYIARCSHLRAILQTGKHNQKAIL